MAIQMGVSIDQHLNKIYICVVCIYKQRRHARKGLFMPTRSEPEPRKKNIITFFFFLSLALFSFVMANCLCWLLLEMMMATVENGLKQLKTYRNSYTPSCCGRINFGWSIAFHLLLGLLWIVLMPRKKEEEGAHQKMLMAFFVLFFNTRDNYSRAPIIALWTQLLSPGS